MPYFVPVPLPLSSPPTDEITTKEATTLLGKSDVSYVRRLVVKGHLTPSRKLPGDTGAYLFWRHDVERIARELAVA